MSFLSEDDLRQLRGAETLFASPIPVQSVASDEFLPAPQTVRQREFEARVKALGARLAKRQGMSRRAFFRTAGGMAAAFLAMNEVYARGGQPLYEASAAEASMPDLAQARADGLKDQFIMDMHTHFLRDDTRLEGFVRSREAVGKAGWNPGLAGRPQSIEDLKFANYFKEIFLDSDTKLACISGSYSVEERDSFLTNRMKFDARERVNREAGTRRMFSHAIFTPFWPGWLDKVDEENETLRPDSWKGYTIGDNTNKHLSKFPYRLDDEKLMYPFYERLAKAFAKYPDRPGLKNVCIHKGLFPPVIEKRFPHLLDYCHVGDVGKAAKDWPQLNFVIYHSAYRWGGGPTTAQKAWEQVERTGRVEWVNDLAEIPAKFGVTNVYADLGQIFAQSTMADPRVCAFMMGALVKGIGADHVVWGTDAIWTGSPQWQIEALRRLEIPEEMRQRYGFAPLGAADGPVKRAILGENNARLYDYSAARRAELPADRITYWKGLYEKHGSERSNLAYGYAAALARG
ncbi:MAG: amidohydrolase [Betaproteobacteria bacterium]|nr:amidohydrolase [Betaproteobacteria bacterium]